PRHLDLVGRAHLRLLPRSDRPLARPRRARHRPLLRRLCRHDRLVLPRHELHPAAGRGARMTRPFLALGFGVAVALGVVFGTALDDAPDRTPTVRGGYRVLEADFHAHTRFIDGFLSPFDLVIQARRRGLDALAITEHNVIFPAQMGRWFSRLTGGPAILVGEEVTTSAYHVHGIGLTERIDASAPLSQVIDDVHR